MSLMDTSPIMNVLNNGVHRSDIGRKQLTLALAGQYVASTTSTAKPLLVWESEKGYARYYVPVRSLHNDIRKQLAETEDLSESLENRGALKLPVQVRVVETLKSADTEDQALIETVTVGSKHTTWARFMSGTFKGFIRFERGEFDDVFENGAISTSIKNPYKRIDTAAVSNHISVSIAGVQVAESNVAVLLNETGLKETYYLPATSIKDWGSIKKSDLKTACPYKGQASYLNITVENKELENRIWYYPYPTHESAAVEGLISFYNKEDTEIVVDGVKV